jgi:calcineurin-like phosphoesterase family protein
MQEEWMSFFGRNNMNQINREEFCQGYSPDKIFVTSDLHLYHTNIIKYCNRQFEYSPKGCAQMNEFILKKFGELPEDCLIWNLGDVFLNLRIEESRIMNDIMRMKKNRKMNLILGNHDFRARKKPFSNYIDYFEHLGFDKVFKGPLEFDNIIFSHEPVFIDSGTSLVNIHGHTHNSMVSEDYFLGEYNKSFPKKKINPAQYINVCMDANHFRIMTFEEILSKIENS